MEKETIIVAMSGGVDSSVTALLLKKQGFNVIGLFMKNWDDDCDSHCSSEKDFYDVQSVCDTLKIPYYTFSFAKEYKQKVFSQFIQDYKDGYTPNPDMLCNKEIKFKLLLNKAKSLGGSLATGHYCNKKVYNNTLVLSRGLDTSKDQSYFLAFMEQQALKDVMFPIGSINKSEVRKIAEEAGLSTAKKKDSVGICFIGKKDFRPFLSNYIEPKEGLIIDLDSKKIIKKHMGAHNYTIGQRKGLEIGGPGEAWFVAKKDINQNIVYVVQGADNIQLQSNTISVSNVNWFFKPSLPFKCSAKIRYRTSDSDCIIKKGPEDSMIVEFFEPQRAVTQKQAAVFYDNDVCLGGGIIDSIIN